MELLNPDGLPKPDVYRQAAVATGTKLVFLSGQVARDADGGAVGAGDLAAQVEQALSLSKCLSPDTPVGCRTNGIPSEISPLVAQKNRSSAKLPQDLDRFARDPTAVHGQHACVHL